MSAVAVIVLACMFVLVVIFTWTALSAAPVFGGVGRAVISICIAAIGVLGLIKSWAPGESAGHPSASVEHRVWLGDVLSAPYGALAVVVLLGTLALLLCWVWRHIGAGRQGQRRSGKSIRRPSGLSRAPGEYRRDDRQAVGDNEEFNDEDAA